MSETTVNTIDLKDLFNYFPALGGMKDEPFGAQTEVPSGETVRGLIAARSARAANSSRGNTVRL